MSSKSTNYTYILLCSDKTLYIGSTNNLEKRLHEHNHAGCGAHYTKIRRPVTLVWSERFDTLSEARKREVVLKKLSRKEKLKLISSSNKVTLDINDPEKLEEEIKFKK